MPILSKLQLAVGLPQQPAHMPPAYARAAVQPAACYAKLALTLRMRYRLGFIPLLHCNLAS